MFDSIINGLEQIVAVGTSILGQDQFFNIIATVLGMGWLWLQRSLNVDRKTDRKWDDILLYVEAGVMQTYQTFVKARKAGSDDGKLTEEEKKLARQQAWTCATQYASKDGINLLLEAGDMAGVLIEKAVGNLKTQCTGPAKIDPPAAVPAAPVVQMPPSLR